MRLCTHCCGSLRFHRLNNGVGEFRGAGSAAHVAGQLAAVAVDLVDGVADLQGGVVLAEMAQHQQRRSQNSGRVGDISSGNVGCGTVHRFKDGALVAEIRAGNEAEAADQSGAEVGKNVAVEILHQQNIVLVGMHHQLHAGVVDDVLAVSDLGILLRNRSRAAQKQSIGHLHHVDFVDGMEFLALVLATILEGETRDASASLLGHDLQALHHSRDDFVFDARVKPFGVFADYDQIDPWVVRGNMRQVVDRPEVGEEFEAPAELDVDAREAAPDGRSYRSLQSDAGALDGLGEFFRNVFLVLLKGFGAGGEAFPFELDASGFEHANRSLDDFGANSVTGDEGYFMRHRFDHVGTAALGCPASAARSASSL